MFHVQTAVTMCDIFSSFLFYSSVTSEWGPRIWLRRLNRLDLIVG